MARYLGVAGAIAARGCEGPEASIDFALCPACAYRPEGLPSCFCSAGEARIDALAGLLPPALAALLAGGSAVPAASVADLHAALDALPRLDDELQPQRQSLAALLAVAQRHGLGLETE